MDTARYEELTAKRDDVGLTDEEADELGKMVAEIEGQTYGNAETLRAEEAAEKGSAPGSATAPDGPCGHLGCGCTTSEPFCSDFCRMHAEEPSAHGPEFDCGCGHDACKTVVGEA
jgi:hypothetical protein